MSEARSTECLLQDAEGGTLEARGPHVSKTPSARDDGKLGERTHLACCFRHPAGNDGVASCMEALMAEEIQHLIPLAGFGECVREAPLLGVLCRTGSVGV
jgi:hypothetical protein